MAFIDTQKEEGGSGDRPGGDASWLTGKLLMAMPGMGDPRFHKAVIFIAAHDKGGAMGIVINHEMAHVNVGLLMAQLSIDVQDGFGDFPVLQGGPVETMRGFLLHSSDFLKDESIPIQTDYAITGTVEVLRDIMKGEGPREKLFALGYAGWGPGQLESEIQANAWLSVDADSELVFRVPNDQKWTRAMAKLGINPAMLSDVAGRA